MGALAARRAPERIGPSAPDVAVLGALLVALAAYGSTVGWGASAIVHIPGFCVLAVASMIDLRERRVPNRLVAWATPAVAALAVCAQVTGDGGGLVSAIAGAVVLTVMFLVIHAKAPSSFGAGDVKIAAIVGMVVCWNGFGELRWLLLWTAVALVVVGGYFVVRRGRGNVPTIPFVPVLAIASVVTVLVPPA